ncbi:hypothetical protein [Nostoc sp.]|uniref:hypothetical protein n=1 Tax=Nostoc sp. TaxID=1180 RepID=UPI002FFC7E86
MLILEKTKYKTNPWIPKEKNQKASKYSHSIKSCGLSISPISIQQNYKSLNLLQDNNCDIYLGNRTKTQTNKASLLRNKNCKRVVSYCRKENLLDVFSKRSLLPKNKHRKTEQITNRPSSYLLKQVELKDTFIKLANQWRSETKHMSLMSDMILHTAYQQIIGMGRDAVPLILEELSREPEHWFWALKSITGANPIKPEDRGRLKKMAEAWLDWGRQHGYKC